MLLEKRMTILGNEGTASAEDKAAVAEAWKRTLELLGQMSLGELILEEIKNMTPEVQEDGSIALNPKNSLVYNVIQEHYFKQIEEIFRQSLGYSAPIYLKKFVSGRKKPEPVRQTAAVPRKKNPFDDMNLPLNDEYTFENFVAGGNNRLALACAQAVAKQPSVKYNPLFIYGSSGLGKTHLMHAIGHEVYRNIPDARVYFTSGEAFTQMYVEAVKANRITELRRKLGNIDLFLLDDVQFLMGKEKTVEEFFNMFNALYESKKQIVLTSDRAPKALEFDERLSSRFEQGVLADVKAPDLESRMAILQNKAANEGMAFTLDVIEYVARLVTGNVRLLNGALTQLIAQSSLLKQVVDVDFARSVLESYYKKDDKKVISIDYILDLCTKEFGVSVEDILGSARTKDIVLARQTAMYLCRDTMEMSLPAIGKAFGKDHSSVLHNVKKMEKLLSEDHNFRLQVNELIAKTVN